MEKPYILHMLTPAANMSPFDVNMAVDAGYDHVFTYANVALEDVANLTQDAIFSRGPKGVKRTALFMGGREVGLAQDMLKAAKKAMVPPFEVSVFADPSGAFTTAGAMVACAASALTKVHGTTLDGKRVVVLAGTGPVGMVAAVLAAQAGAATLITSHSSLERAQRVAEEIRTRYQVNVASAVVKNAQDKHAIVGDAHAVLACGKAGVQLLDAADLAQAKNLLVAADVNAVPPEGIAGIGVMDNAKALAAASGKAVGIGALAIGNVKYQTQKGLLEAMRAAEKPRYLDFRDAYEIAKTLA